jgi:hypothetical protein
MSEPITIRLKAHGLDCWHRVAVLPIKLPLLARLQAGESISITELGTVLASGWGEPPAENIDYSKVDA